MSQKIKTLICIWVMFLIFSNPLSARESEKKFNVMFDYGLINLPFPSSVGLEATYHLTDGFALGLDYQRSKIALDLFSFEIFNLAETNFVLQSRMYAGKHFNFLIGMGRRKTSLNLPQTYFQLLTGGSEPVSELQATILRLGLGHKWVVKKKYRLAIDWIHLDIPVYARTNISAASLADPDDVDDVQSAEKIIRWYPSGVLAQFKIGLAF